MPNGEPNSMIPTDVAPHVLYAAGSTWKIDLSQQTEPDYDYLCPYVKVVMNGYYEDRLVFGSAYAMGAATGTIYLDLPVWFNTTGATLVQEAP